MFRAALVDDRAINQIISEQFPGVQVSRECYLEVSGDWNKRLYDYVITGPSLKFIDPVQFALFHLQRLRRDKLDFFSGHAGVSCWSALLRVCFCSHLLSIPQKPCDPRVRDMGLLHIYLGVGAARCTSQNPRVRASYQISMSLYFSPPQPKR